MISWPSSARSARKTSPQKKSTRRFGFDRPQCEWLEPRLMLAADLSISKSQIAPLSAGNPAAVTAGEMISYQITVANSNTATSAATNTTIIDPLPQGETLIHASLDNGGVVSLNNNSILANVGTLNAGEAATLTVDALVNGSVSGTLTNTASVSTSDENNGLPIVSSPVSTPLNSLGNAAANLSITKTAANNNAAVSSGGTETYTITVANNSTNAATNVVVSDVLPAGATLGAVTGAVSSTATGSLESIKLGTIGGNQSATVTMTITAPNTVGLMVNTATVTTDSGNTNVAGAVTGVATSVQGTTAPSSGSVDLSITKTAPANGSIGGSETSTIVVTNKGTAEATGVVVSDELPPNSVFVGGSVVDNSNVNVANVNGLVSATLPTLAAGASATLSITLAPTITGALTNNAYVEANQPDSDQTNNHASATVLVNGALSPAVDLAVTKTGGSATGTVNSNLTYTITVSNNSGNAASGVILSDALPSGAAFVSATDSSGASITPSGNQLVDRIGNLAANGTATLTVTLTPSAVGVLTDTASVVSDQIDSNLANNTATVSTPVQGTTSANVDLGITKTAANDNASIGLGTNETYTLVVTNHGTAAATGVVVTDGLPASVNFVSGTTSVTGVNVTNANGAVTASLNSLGAGDSATVTLTVTPTVAGSITDMAYVEGNETDTQQLNNSATVTTNVVSPAQQANLSIFKVATPNPVTVNQALTYTLIVTNTGAAAADNVVVSDSLPGGVTFVSSSTDASGGSVSNSSGTVTANLGSIAAGAIDTVTIVVTPTQSGTITNKATVSTSTVNASTHTSASVDTTVNPVVNAQANLSIYKVAAPNPGTVGQNETYVLVVANTGAAAAADVNVSDTLPAGVTFVSADTSVTGVSATNNNGTVTATLGSVAPGAVDTVTIIVTPTQAGILTNSATVTTTTPNSSTHTTASINTTINPSNNNQANLSITKTAAPNPGTVGQSLTYTIVVSDAAGAADAAGVVVTDTLPSAGIGTQVTAQDTTRNVSLTVTNGKIIDNIGTVAAGGSDTITVTVTPTQTGTLTNTASVATTTSNSSSQTTATTQTTINPSNGNQANLSITKTASPNPGTVGQSLTYTIVVSDAAGAADAAGVVVTDTLPSAGIGTQVTAQDTTRNVSLTVTNGKIIDNIGTVAAGGSDTITVTVTPTQTGTLTNTASVAATTSNSSSQTTATTQTTINPSNGNQANLSIIKTAAPNPGTVGQSLTYTIVVSDAAGAADAAGVVVTDTLPSTGIGAQVTAQDTTRNISLTVNNGVITDNIGTVAAGGSDTITVTVTPTQTGTLTNTASVTTTTSNSSHQTSATIQTAVNALSQHFCYLNGQPGDGSDQTFLTNLYRELLGRNPDSQGYQFWLNLLQQSSGNAAAERQHIIQTFLHSQEYEAHWIDCVYEEFLGRHADEGGQKQFVRAMDAGLTMQTVLVDVLSSPEYLAHNGHTNAAFVQAIYQDLLGRTASQTDQQALAGALDSGQLTRGQVVRFVLTSPEAAHDLLDARGATPGAPGTAATGNYPLAVVTGGGWDNLYFQGRLGALDSGAVDQFMGELESGTSWQAVEQDMLTLPQYYNGG